MPSLHEILDMQNQPRRMERHLLALISAGGTERLEANNLLAVCYWHQNDLAKAVNTFKSTIAMEPYGMESIWAMQMLSCLYRRLGLRAERADIEMQRLRTLRRLLYSSQESEKVRFACEELKREWDERGLSSTLNIDE